MRNVRFGPYIRDTVTSPGLAREHLPTRSDAAAYIAWLRREQIFRDCLHDLRVALGRERHGEPGSNIGPEQLRQHASDVRRSARFLDSVRRLSSVLPPSARGFWPLLLDEGVDLIIGPGQSLTHQEWGRLTTVVRSRLFDDGSDLDSGDLSVADATFLERTLRKIDPAAPVLMPAAWAGAATSRPRKVAAVNAMSAAVGSWSAMPSVEANPVVGQIATVTAVGQVLTAPLAPPSPRKTFVY